MTTPASQLPSIVISDVTKVFRLRHAHSFKDAFLSLVRRKAISSRFLALNGVSLEIREGESVALLGYNGSGKSTLLKLISGVLLPDKGRILTRGRVAGLIEVGAGFHPDLTGRDNVYLNAAILGMSRKEIDERFDDIVAFSEIGDFIDTEVKHYSSGMFLRLAFSVAIHTELDVLLVDEILAVGDAPFRKKCQAKIEELIHKGKTMVVVSHDADMVKALCSRGVVLRKGKLVFDGPIDDAVSMLSSSDGGSADVSFTDVPLDAAYTREVHWLASSGITTGFPDGSFRPNDPVARNAMAAFLYRFAGAPSFEAPQVSPFADVSPLDPFYEQITWLASSGTVAPDSDSAFCPDEPVRRDVMASFLYAFAGSPVYLPPAVSPFSDVTTSDPNYREIAWLASTGIATPYSDGTFRAHYPVARSTLATFLFRYHDKGLPLPR